MKFYDLTPPKNKSYEPQNPTTFTLNYLSKICYLTDLLKVCKYKKNLTSTLDWLFLETDTKIKQTNIFTVILKRAVIQHQRNALKS